MVAGHDKITKEGKKFFAQLEELAKMQVRVGFQHGDDKDDRGTDIADIAMWNELGTSNGIPSRPFMRQSVDNNADTIKAMCKAQIQAVATGKSTAKQALQQIGVMQKGLVQSTIRDGDFEPNKPSTVKQKGSDRPLINTGRLRQSVSVTVAPRKG